MDIEKQQEMQEKFNKHMQNYSESKAKGTITNTFTAMLTDASQYSRQYMFYGHMIARCKKSIDPILQAPAAVSFEHTQYVLHINPMMFSFFTLQERLGILKHEMLHILNGHINRLEDREMQGWNYATDCAINQLIDPDHLPEDCVNPDNYPSEKNVPHNETAEFYYNLLEDPKNPTQDEDDGKDGEGEGNSNGTPSGPPTSMDDHGKWAESQGDEDLQKDITKDLIEKAMDNTVKSRGTLPSSISEYLSLHSRKNEVNWKNVLRNIIGNKRANVRRTITRRDRRFPNRPEIKGKTKDRVFNLLVVSDVSGSVSNEALTDLLGEINHLCKLTNTPVDLIQVDTQPYPPEKLKANTKTIERKAMGGTELSPALETAKEYKVDYNAVVVTTDGYLWEGDIRPFKEIKKPVIWLIEPNGEIMPEMQEGLMKAFKLKEQG